MTKADPSLPPEFRVEEPGSQKRPPGRVRIEEAFADQIESICQRRKLGWQTLKSYVTRSAAHAAARRLTEKFPYEETRLEFRAHAVGGGADLKVRFWTDEERAEAALVAERAASAQKFASKYERALSAAVKAAQAPVEPTTNLDVTMTAPDPEKVKEAVMGALRAHTEKQGVAVEDIELVPMGDLIDEGWLTPEEREMTVTGTIDGPFLGQTDEVDDFGDPSVPADDDDELVALFESTEASPEDVAILQSIEAEQETPPAPPFAPRFGLGR